MLHRVLKQPQGEVWQLLPKTSHSTRVGGQRGAYLDWHAKLSPQRTHHVQPCQVVGAACVLG